MTRAQAIDHIVSLEYGKDNAEAWTLAAGFADDHKWAHPSGGLTVTWLGQDSYAVMDDFTCGCCGAEVEAYGGIVHTHDANTPDCEC